MPMGDPMSGMGAMPMLPTMQPQLKAKPNAASQVQLRTPQRSNTQAAQGKLNQVQQMQPPNNGALSQAVPPTSPLPAAVQQFTQKMASILTESVFERDLKALTALDEHGLLSIKKARQWLKTAGDSAAKDIHDRASESSRAAMVPATALFGGISSMPTLATVGALMGGIGHEDDRVGGMIRGLGHGAAISLGAGLGGAVGGLGGLGLANVLQSDKSKPLEPYPATGIGTVLGSVLGGYAGHKIADPLLTSVVGVPKKKKKQKKDEDEEKSASDENTFSSRFSQATTDLGGLMGRNATPLFGAGLAAGFGGRELLLKMLKLKNNEPPSLTNDLIGSARGLATTFGGGLVGSGLGAAVGAALDKRGPEGARVGGLIGMLGGGFAGTIADPMLAELRRRHRWKNNIRLRDPGDDLHIDDEESRQKRQEREERKRLRKQSNDWQDQIKPIAMGAGGGAVLGGLTGLFSPDRDSSLWERLGKGGLAGGMMIGGSTLGAKVGDVIGDAGSKSLGLDGATGNFATRGASTVSAALGALPGAMIMHKLMRRKPAPDEIDESDTDEAREKRVKAKINNTTRRK